MDIVAIGQYTPGMPVEVRTRYLSNWSSGFEVASVDGDHVGVRRLSDSVILPVTIAVDDVRPCESEPEHR